MQDEEITIHINFDKSKVDKNKAINEFYIKEIPLNYEIKKIWIKPNNEDNKLVSVFFNLYYDFKQPSNLNGVIPVNTKAVALLVNTKLDEQKNNYISNYFPDGFKLKHIHLEENTNPDIYFAVFELYCD